MDLSLSDFHRFNSSDFLFYDDYEPTENIETEWTWSIIYREIARYYVLIVIVFGLLGNIGCLICYRRSDELKQYRSTGYLIALALSDLTFLICLTLVWLKSVGINWQDWPGICQSTVYASNSAIFLSSWYVTILTGEMAFALHRPISAYTAAIHSRITVIIRIGLVTAIGFAINSWTLILTKTSQIDQENRIESDYIDSDLLTNYDLEILLNRTEMFFPSISDPTGCHISTNNQLLHGIFVLMDVTLTYLIPVVTTLILNCYIGYKLIEAGQQRRQMSQSSLIDRKNRSATSSYGRTHSGDTDQIARSLQIPMTRMNRKRKTEIHSKRNTERTRLIRIKFRRDAQQFVRSPLIGFDFNRSGLTNGKSPIRQRSFNQNGRHKETTISSLLIAKSIAYLIFNTPSCVHRIWLMLKRQQQAANTDESDRMVNGKNEENWVHTIIYVLFYTQFSMNFLFYSYHACARRKYTPAVRV